MVNRCKECNKIVSKDARRGLCRPCYRNPEVRECHETLPRGTWKESDSAKQWTMFEEGRLKVLFEKGLSDKQIAKELNRSEGSVCKKRQRSRSLRRLYMKVSPSRQGLHRRRDYLEKLCKV